MNRSLVALLVILVVSTISYRLTSVYASNFRNSFNEHLNDTITKSFSRHGIFYVDKIVKGKIVQRKVSDSNKILYKYPVNKDNVGNPNIRLVSGNTYLKKMGMDTIQFSNRLLPPMNMSVFIKGGAVFIRQLSDSAYIIKSTSNTDSIAKFYIRVSDNYEEIQHREGFLLDSLIIPVK